MATTYTLIDKATVGSGGVASISFTSIPSTYTDLLLRVSGRSTRSSYYDNISIKPNGSTSNRSTRYILGYEGGVISGTTTDGSAISGMAGNTATSNTFGSTDIYIPNYASSNYKSFSIDAVGENNSSNSRTGLSAMLWSDTAAITSIEIIPDADGGASFMEYTTAYLYGIKNS